jgi:hypothetical protein
LKEPRSVVVKTFVADKEPAKVFDFFVDVKNWESGRVQKNVRKADGDWWELDSPFGKARVRVKPNRALGIFDHDFVGAGLEWTVFCRVTPNGRGSTISWLFIRPEGMPQEEFERQLGSSFEEEMANFKKAIESIS